MASLGGLSCPSDVSTRKCAVSIDALAVLLMWVVSDGSRNGVVYAGVGLVGMVALVTWTSVVTVP